MRKKNMVVITLVTTVVVVSLSALAWFFVVLPWLRSLRNPYREAAKIEQQAKDEAKDKEDKDDKQSKTQKVVLVGTVKREQTVEPTNVVASDSGVLREVAVGEGQEVQEGDLLFVIEVPTTNDSEIISAQEALMAAQQQYADAKAYYDSVVSGNEAAMDDYESAHAAWEDKYATWQANMETYDAAVADAEWRRENNPDDYDENGVPVAYINVEWPGEAPAEPMPPDDVQASQEAADEGVYNASYAVESAQARLDDAISNSSSTERHEILAPVAGTVLSSRATEGLAVLHDEAKPLMTIGRTSEAHVEADVKEGDGTALVLGSHVEVTFPTVEDLKLSATVKSASKDKVTLAFEGDDERLVDGLEARVEVEVENGPEAKSDEDESGGAEEGTGEDAQAEGEGDEADGDGTESENPDAQEIDAVDVSNVDYDVAAMDDAAAFDFMHDFLNRTPDEHATDFGKVMHIKGQVGRYAKIEGDGEKVSYNVGVKGEDGVIWAINFYVRGWTGDDYPEHKSIVEVTGEYGEVEGYGTNAGKTLICNPEDVKIVEE